jgi:hypothetical protein
MTGWVTWTGGNISYRQADLRELDEDGYARGRYARGGDDMACSGGDMGCAVVTRG